MKKFLSVTLFALGLVAAGEVKAQAKIGFISSQELVSVMPETRKADSTLTRPAQCADPKAQLKSKMHFTQQLKNITKTLLLSLIL